MSPRLLQLLALGALIATGTVTEAAAGSPCCGGCAAACVVPVVVPARPIYVVNQGPMYTGPGIVTYPGYFEGWAAPVFYPYVSVDYVYPPYFEPRYRHVHYGHGFYHRPYRRPLDPRDK